MLADALAQSGDDLLDAIPSYGPRPPKAPKQVWTHLQSAPNPKEIDELRTSDEMILDGKAVLRDGRCVSW
jgi:hypothetical protein